MKVDESIDWGKLVLMTEGYSGADLSNVCREASMMPLRRKLLSGININMSEIEALRKDVEVPLTMEDFIASLKNTQKSVGKESLDDYAKWMAEFGSV